MIIKKSESKLYQNVLEDQYQIIKINLMDDKIYIIYAQKNDSIYKIISKKDLIPTLHCIPIKEEKEYFLKLQLFYPQEELLGIKIQPSHTIKGVAIDENIIVETEEASHYSLYFVENLRGLCLLE
jgi:hypothetical protein